MGLVLLLSSAIGSYPERACAESDSASTSASTLSAARATSDQDIEALTIRNWRQARDLLRRNHPQLQQAKAQLTRAQAATSQALANLLPQVGLSGTVSYLPIRSLQIPGEDRDLGVSGSAFIRQQLSLSGASQYESADEARIAQSHSLAATRHDLVEGLGVALLQAMAAERVATQFQASFNAAQARMAVSQRLLELGRATALDTVRFEQDMYEAERSLVEAQESMKQAQESLGLALGLSSRARVPESFDLNSLLTLSADSGCKALRNPQQRPEVRAATTSVISAQTAASAARQAYLPELQLSVSYEHRLESSVSGASERVQLNDLVAGATLSWTLWDSGTRAAGINAADAELARVQGVARELQMRVEILARRTARAVTVAQRNLSIAQQALNSTQTADELSRRAFELGKATALEGVEAARNLRAAQINATLREAELLIALLRASLFSAQCR